MFKLGIGAKELAKDWINLQEDYDLKKERIVSLIQGSAAIGIGRKGSPVHHG